ncbi:MAG: twin-arginine translocase subunit TatC [Desulfobacterota bacterium]|nr:twin-arginine translocase subunit TatC [Thermodesulfobacteriota bacterium]MDW8001548.1 twin-arginine translocase subunit TatC [Deltaproteobacteria bacterium]
MERERLIVFLGGVRRSVLHSLLVIGIVSLVSFFFAKDLFSLLTKVVGIKLYYFTLPEVFFSMVELALLSGTFFSVPFILFIVWKNLKPTFRISFYYFLAAGVLFYLGSLFCYLFVLKSGIMFLLGYGGEHVKPFISIERYIVFSGAFIFAFGLTFQTPILLLLLRKLGLIKYDTLAKHRRLAILLITIFAAVITPTPDVYNMLLLAGPTYLLYEVGSLMVKMDELRRRRSGDR